MKRTQQCLLWLIALLLFLHIPAHAQYPPIPILANDSVERELQRTPAYKRKPIKIIEENIIKVMDALPPFAIYKDNFFSTGVPLNTNINKQTADALFQISIRHRLTRSVLPFNTFLFLTYTQKSFWDIYDKSSPFRDSNYNPGIGLGRYIIYEQNMLGAALFQFEHESNGRDGEDSRSWNLLSFSAKYFYNPRLSFSMKAWVPFVSGRNNKSLVNYRGIATLSANYLTKDLKWWVSAEVTPRKGWGNANTIVSVAFLGSKNSTTYFYLRFYNGIGDSLLDFNKYAMNVRAGICFKPDFYSIF